LVGYRPSDAVWWLTITVSIAALVEFSVPAMRRTAAIADDAVARAITARRSTLA
jgi:hypothetical protein